MRVAGRFVGVGLVAVIAIGLGSAPAWAHGADPTLVALLTEVRPALPPEVAVQVRTGYSEQMLVANPTDTPLTVLDPDGVGFLRVSSAGVFGNVTAPYLHATAGPPDSPMRIPPQARPGAEPRWVPLSEGDAWGWFERRLHPFVPGQEPTFPQQRAVLASWQVELSYGDRPVTVAGVLERRPVTGAFRATVDPRDDQLSVGIGQGLLPAVQLTAPPGQTITVGGSDGVPFLRIDQAGVAANPASVHYGDNPQFQGLPAGPDGWLRVGETPSVTWLDSRLRYHADRPPDDVEAAAAVAELGRWNIPVTVDGQARPLTGTVEWVPSAAAAIMIRTDAPGTGFPWATAGLSVGAAALLVALGALLLRNRARATS